MRKTGDDLVDPTGEMKREFREMLRAAECEADRDGVIAIDSVLREIDEIIPAGL